MRFPLILLLAATPAWAAGGEAAQQRLVERYAETVAFPLLVERCAGRAGQNPTQWRSDLAQWRQRRDSVLAEATALVDALARESGTPRATMDAAIASQSALRHDAASPEDLDFTCQRLGRTLRGEPWLPTRGLTALDEDSQREVLDQMLPVAITLMACEAIEGVEITAAPPPTLRRDPSEASRLADSVEMWNLAGCGKRLDVELSLRFFPDDPPAFSMAFPRRATPLD